MEVKDSRQTELARRARVAAEQGTTSSLPGMGSMDSVNRAVDEGAISAEKAERLRTQGSRKLLENLKRQVAARKSPSLQNLADIADLEKKIG